MRIARALAMLRTKQVDNPGASTTICRYEGYILSAMQDFIPSIYRLKISILSRS